MTRTQLNILSKWREAVNSATYASPTYHRSWRCNRNDMIIASGSTVSLYYRGNCVATLNTETNYLNLDTCGWATPTTKSRFEVLCETYRLPAPRISRSFMVIGTLSGSRFGIDLNAHDAQRAPLAIDATHSSLPVRSGHYIPKPETDLFT